MVVSHDEGDTPSRVEDGASPNPAFLHPHSPSYFDDNMDAIITRVYCIWCDGIGIGQAILPPFQERRGDRLPSVCKRCWESQAEIGTHEIWTPRGAYTMPAKLGVDDNATTGRGK